MEKIKRFAFAVMLTAVVSMAVACGRNNNNGTGNTTSGAAGTSAAAGTSGNSVYDNNSTTMTGASGESGGVLGDMAEDLRDGIDDLTGNTTEAGPGNTTEAGPGATNQSTNATGTDGNRK